VLRERGVGADLCEAWLAGTAAYAEARVAIESGALAVEEEEEEGGADGGGGHEAAAALLRARCALVLGAPDLALSVGRGSELLAHRCLLAARSPTLARLLRGAFPAGAAAQGGAAGSAGLAARLAAAAAAGAASASWEGGAGGVGSAAPPLVRLSLPDLTVPTALLLLEFAYCDTLRQLPQPGSRRLSELLLAAARYELPRLQALCVQLLAAPAVFWMRQLTREQAAAAAAGGRAEGRARGDSVRPPGEGARQAAAGDANALSVYISTGSERKGGRGEPEEEGEEGGVLLHLQGDPSFTSPLSLHAATAGSAVEALLLAPSSAGAAYAGIAALTAEREGAGAMLGSGTLALVPARLSDGPPAASAAGADGSTRLQQQQQRPIDSAASAALALTDPAASLPAALLQLLCEPDYADVGLSSGDGWLVRAHSLLLAARAPFFARLLARSAAALLSPHGAEAKQPRGHGGGGVTHPAAGEGSARSGDAASLSNTDAALLSGEGEDGESSDGGFDDARSDGDASEEAAEAAEVLGDHGSVVWPAGDLDGSALDEDGDAADSASAAGLLCLQLPDAPLTVTRLLFYIHTGALPPLPAAAVADAAMGGGGGSWHPARAPVSQWIPGCRGLSQIVEAPPSAVARCGDFADGAEGAAGSELWSPLLQLAADLTAAQRYGLPGYAAMLEAALAEHAATQLTRVHRRQLKLAAAAAPGAGLAQGLDLPALLRVATASGAEGAARPALRHAACALAVVNLDLLTSHPGFPSLAADHPQLVEELVLAARSRAEEVAWAQERQRVQLQQLRLLGEPLELREGRGAAEAEGTRRTVDGEGAGHAAKANAAAASSGVGDPLADASSEQLVLRSLPGQQVRMVKAVRAALAVRGNRTVAQALAQIKDPYSLDALLPWWLPLLLLPVVIAGGIAATKSPLLAPAIPLVNVALVLTLLLAAVRGLAMD
jgi:hypothetical protein